MQKRLPLVLAVVLALGCAQPDATSEKPTEASASQPETAPAPSCERWVAVDTESTASFRGLSAVDERELWVSGTGGTLGHSADAGVTWSFQVLPGAGELDFRDVDAFPGGIAYAMSAGPGEASQIHKTVDGGATWTRQFLNPHETGFLDGMAFWDAERGLAYGDPVDGAFFILRTEDGGATWTRVAAESLPPALEGEAGFAASGSGLTVLGDGLAFFGSGGAAARVFRSADFGLTWQVADTPLAAGEPSKGVFSIAFLDARRGAIVGGDYQQPEIGELNAAWTEDGGVTWTLASSPPAGYRSAVGATAQGLIALGTAGADLSTDGGKTWSFIGPEGALAKPSTEGADGEAERELALNVLAAAEGPCAIWAAGPDGVLLRWLDADAAP